jgi:hypothetical protein
MEKVYQQIDKVDDRQKHEDGCHMYIVLLVPLEDKKDRKDYRHPKKLAIVGNLLHIESPY